MKPGWENFEDLKQTIIEMVADNNSDREFVLFPSNPYVDNGLYNLGETGLRGLQLSGATREEIIDWLSQELGC